MPLEIAIKVEHGMTIRHVNMLFKDLCKSSGYKVEAHEWFYFVEYC